MPKRSDTILLIDGNYILHRSLRQPELALLGTSKGMPTGGVFGFLKALRKAVTENPGITKIISCFDGGRSQRRLTLYPEYKAHRKKPEPVEVSKPSEMVGESWDYGDLFAHQAKYVRRVLPNMGIPCISFSGKEGDDIIGHLVRSCRRTKWIVLSADKDFYQLLSRRNVELYFPAIGKRSRKGESSQKIRKESLRDQLGFSPKRYLLYKSFLRDDSDNVTGVPGVGVVTATEIVKNCRTVEEVAAFCQKHPHARYRKAATPESLRILRRNLDIYDLRREHFSGEEILLLQESLRAPAQPSVGKLKKIGQELEITALARDPYRFLEPFRFLSFR